MRILIVAGNIRNLQSQQKVSSIRRPVSPSPSPSPYSSLLTIYYRRMKNGQN